MTSNNLYLNIENQKEGRIYLSAHDDIFLYSIHWDDKDDFQKYCDERADIWLNSNLGNFKGLTKQKRKSIAHKWAIAKNLPEGKYDYYFNFGSKENIFCEKVADLARSIGIENYTLTIE